MNELTKTQKLSHVPGHISVRRQSFWDLYFSLPVHSYILNYCIIAGGGEKLGQNREGKREGRTAGKDTEKRIRYKRENESTS